MRNSFTIISFFTLVMTSCAQYSNGNQSEENSILIGDYMILPDLDEVRAYKMVGGVNWDGYTYEKDPKIDYANTTLLIIDEFVFFKEYFPYNFDLETFRKLHKNDVATICRDKNSLYSFSNYTVNQQIDITKYEVISDFIYKGSNGKLLFLDAYEFKLKPLDILVDLKTLKHISNNYFYDKNGLYIFGPHNAKVNNERKFFDTSKKLLNEYFDPIIASKYIIYGEHIFATSNDNWVRELDLDPKKSIAVAMSDTESFISDGKAVYSDLNYGYDEDEKNGKGYYGIWYPTLYSNVTLQKVYSPRMNFQREDQNSSTIIVNRYDPNNFPGLLVKINDQNYLLNDKKKHTINKILFYHAENGKYTEFDDQYLKIFSFEGFMKYQNMLYFNSLPVDLPNFDVANLKEIKDSNYLTDGKNIISIGSIGGYGSIEKNGIEFATFNDRILENTYNEDLHPINRDLLSDGKTIISNNQKIKIADLKLRVKIIE